MFWRQDLPYMVGCVDNLQKYRRDVGEEPIFPWS